MKSVTRVQVLPAPAVIAILENAPVSRRMPAQLMETEGRWMTLQIQESLTPGAAVRVDVQGGLVLGTTAWVERDTNGYLLRVEIDQVIPDTVGLERLVSAVLGRPPVDSVYVPVPSTSATLD